MQQAAYATFWERAGAHVVDCVITAVPGYLLGLAFSNVLADEITSFDSDPMTILGITIWAYVSAIILSWIYFASMEGSSFRATIGKQLFGLQVVDADTMSEISFPQASGRYFASLLSALPFCAGYFVQPFTLHKQTWHDRLSGCVVLRERRSVNMEQSPLSRGGFAPLDEKQVSSPGNATAVSEVEEQFYINAAKELGTAYERRGLWIKASSERTNRAGQRARYIELRVQ